MRTASPEGKLQNLSAEREERASDREARRITSSRDRSLTDDREARVAAVRSEFGPESPEAGTELRAAIREEVGHRGGRQGVTRPERVRPAWC